MSVLGKQTDLSGAVKAHLSGGESSGMPAGEGADSPAAVCE